MRFLYNLFLPVGFLFFLPGLLYKFRNRGGWKSTFGERFGRFSPRRTEELAAFRGAIWIHAVSVGETVVALSLIRSYLQLHPERKFVISTTTTTGQELARQKGPENCAVIFCPIDFRSMVRRTFDVLRPAMLVIFETELWPNMIWETKARGIPLMLANGRMSDHSASGYQRAKCFFAPLFRSFDRLLVQSEADLKRYLSVAPDANAAVAGNLKFDQQLPTDPGDPEYEKYFGPGKFILLGASTHSGEEELISETFLALRKDFPDLRLVLVPRHAERGEDIAAMLAAHGLKFFRRSADKSPDGTAEVLLADTTGEMIRLMGRADIVIMGKSLAGHDEGHNLIEPALLNKPIVTGHVLRNFRYLLNVLLEGNAVATVTGDDDLAVQLRNLIEHPQLRKELGERAGLAVARHRGAARRTIDEMETLLAQYATLNRTEAADSGE